MRGKNRRLADLLRNGRGEALMLLGVDFSVVTIGNVLLCTQHTLEE
jgi:hypothetical protein